MDSCRACSRNAQPGYHCAVVSWSEPPVSPAPVTDRDDMDHQEVVDDREDRPVVPDPERVERGVVRPFSFLRCFFGSVSPASDASSSPICTAGSGNAPPNKRGHISRAVGTRKFVQSLSKG